MSDRPKEIWWAFGVIVCSLLSILPSCLLSIALGQAEDPLYQLIFVSSLTLAYALLLWVMVSGRNWARMLYLILASSGLVLQTPMLFGAEYGGVSALIVLRLLCDSTAIYILNRPVVRNWYANLSWAGYDQLANGCNHRIGLLNRFNFLMIVALVLELGGNTIFAALEVVGFGVIAFPFLSLILHAASILPLQRARNWSRYLVSIPNGAICVIYGSIIMELIATTETPDLAITTYIVNLLAVMLCKISAIGLLFQPALDRLFEAEAPS